MKIAKMAYSHCCVPLFNNDKRYDSSKDLSYFSFDATDISMRLSVRLVPLFELPAMLFAAMKSFPSNHSLALLRCDIFRMDSL